MGKAMISLGDLHGAFVSANKHLNVASKVSYSRCTSSLDFIIIFYSSIVTNTSVLLEET